MRQVNNVHDIAGRCFHSQTPQHSSSTTKPSFWYSFSSTSSASMRRARSRRAAPHGARLALCLAFVVALVVVTVVVRLVLAFAVLFLVFVLVDGLGLGQIDASLGGGQGNQLFTKRLCDLKSCFDGVLSLIHI